MISHFLFQPVLENAIVTIRPLLPEHFEALFSIASDPLVWEQHPAKERSTLPGFEKWFEEAMSSNKALFISEQKTGAPVGTSRYKEVDEDPTSVEIGWTFIGRKWWGRGYNQAIKKVMLTHAFTHYDRVLFFVDKENYRSQKAVAKIGAKRISVEFPSQEERAKKSYIYEIHKREFLDPNPVNS